MGTRDRLSIEPRRHSDTGYRQRQIEESRHQHPGRRARRILYPDGCSRESRQQRGRPGQYERRTDRHQLGHCLSPTRPLAGYAYAVPSNLMKKVIGDTHEIPGSVQRGYLGISMAPEGLEDAEEKRSGYQHRRRRHLYREVDPNGAAGEAGIKKGDVIVKINDLKVDEDAELANLSPGRNPAIR